MNPYLLEWRLLPTAQISRFVKTPADIIDLGEQALVAAEVCKNTDVSPPASQEEAIAKLAKKHRVSVEEMRANVLTSKDLKDSLEREMKPGKYLNISLPISAAVTAYARMNIYQYKNSVVSPGGTLYYSDTDTVFTSIPIPEDMVSADLGMMKLEYQAEKAIFLAPVSYE